MSDVYRHYRNNDIIANLRNMAIEGAQPSEVLTHLRTLIQDKDSFIEYMIAAFVEDGDLRMVAFRWWHGDISELATNILLKNVFEDCVTHWISE